MFLPVILTALAGSPAEEWVAGTWNVTLTTDYSSCETTKKGETATEQWVFGRIGAVRRASHRGGRG
jgi:hypothetical protein